MSFGYDVWISAAYGMPSEPALPVLEPVDALEQLADLFTDEEAWTKGANARDEHGEPCEPEDDRARCFCFAGGLRRICGGYSESYIDAMGLLDRAEDVNHDAQDLNDADDTTFAVARDLIHTAIALGRAEAEELLV